MVLFSATVFYVILVIHNSDNRVLKRVYLLALADDIKLFYHVDKLNDSLIPQSELNNLVSWANNLRLEFNIDKSHSMNCTRKSSPIVFNYIINGLALVSLKRSVNDLGFIFDPSLHPNLYIELVCCKTFVVNLKVNYFFKLLLF